MIWTLDRNVSPDLWLIICWCFTPAYYYLWHCRIVSRVKCRCSWRLYSCTRRWGVWNDRKCDTDCGVVWLPLLYEAEVEILSKFCFYILLAARLTHALHQSTEISFWNSLQNIQYLIIKWNHMTAKRWNLAMIWKKRESTNDFLGILCRNILLLWFLYVLMTIK